jgi:hypothetical protein
VCRLKALYQQLTTTAIGTLLDRLLAVGEAVGLLTLGPDVERPS